MTQEEAQREADRLNADHPDRERLRWFPRREPTGEWSVARVPTVGNPVLTESTAPPPPAPREESPNTVANRITQWGGG